MLLPIAFTNYTTDNKDIILAGDLGGTKVNMALYQAGEKSFTALREQSFHSKDYNSLTTIIKEFAGKEALPDKICVAVAGPVIEGKVRLTNLDWQLDSEALKNELKVKSIAFINDLEATAFGLAGLLPDELSKLDEGTHRQQGNIAIIAPGTGLGEAGLYWDGKSYHPFATEGGHSPFASRNTLDVELYNWLATQFDYVCWEHVLCGPGIYNIFRFLTEVKKNPVPDWLINEMKKEDRSAVISESAIAGNNEACVQTMDLYIRYLATEASSLVLKYKATGGLFLAGGIPPKILPLIKKSKWQELFFQSDRMQALLQQTPVNVILNDKAPLLGAAYYGAYNL